jgi:DNA-binding CsgD family transcriptional regulator
MGRSQRPKNCEVRDIMRLVREACELGDANAWREHVLARLLSILGAAKALSFVMRPPADGRDIPAFLYVPLHIDPRYSEFCMQGDLSPDPCTEWIVPRLPSGFIRTRSQICDNRIYHRSQHFNEVLRPVRQDHFLISVFSLPDRGCVSGLTILREPGEPDFSDRALRLLALLHEELGALWRSDPLQPPVISNLPRQLRKVLDGLHRGLSEKQIASELELARSTVHNHITRLHRAMNVSSRGELLAACQPKHAFRPRLLPAPLESGALVD